MEKRNVVEKDVTPDQSIGVDDDLVKQAVAVFGRDARTGKPEAEEASDAGSDNS